MVNTGRLLKLGVAWISIVYVVCFVSVALFPSLRQQCMLYALHTNMSAGQNVMTLATFVIGLIMWNIIAALMTGLFAVLLNTIRL
jgi:2TM family of unknown function (DUF5676)